jgi:TonB family protein
MSDGSPGNARINYLAVGGISMLFAALTLVFQALVPAPANAAPMQSSPTAAVVAAACTKPNADPAAVNPAAPQVPFRITRVVSAVVAVTITPSGSVAGAKIYKSSGNAAIDKAVLTAAEKSTYSPKIVNCVAVQGTYLFYARFAP